MRLLKMGRRSHLHKEIMLSARPKSEAIKDRSKLFKKVATVIPVEYKQPITTHFEFFGPHFSSINLIALPIVVVYLYHVCDGNSCPNFDKPIYPQFDNIETGMAVYLSWIAVHLLLYKILPGETAFGSKTPDGQRLPYKINGLASLMASLGMLAALYYRYGYSPFLWVDENFLSLISAGIIFTSTTSIFLY